MKVRIVSLVLLFAQLVYFVTADLVEISSSTSNPSTSIDTPASSSIAAFSSSSSLPATTSSSIEAISSSTTTKFSTTTTPSTTDISKATNNAVIGPADNQSPSSTSNDPDLSVETSHTAEINQQVETTTSDDLNSLAKPTTLTESIPVLDSFTSVEGVNLFAPETTVSPTLDDENDEDCEEWEDEEELLSPESTLANSSEIQIEKITVTLALESSTDTQPTLEAPGYASDNNQFLGSNEQQSSSSSNTLFLSVGIIGGLVVLSVFVGILWKRRFTKKKNLSPSV
ncbi:hypothetical protein HK096_011386 [Nowakowskiella sp. JEL0078]|nr:hypothetical protein HK096_011386 [Nowakowskiella sp. JEL0078]